VCILQLWSFEKLDLKVQTSFSLFSPYPHLLLSSSSYPWLPMMVSLFLTHLLLEVASPITFPPSSFCCNWSSRSKWLYWWRRSKAYKLYMDLHYFPLLSLSQFRWLIYDRMICHYLTFILKPNWWTKSSFFKTNWRITFFGKYIHFL